jgi:hypothetical protein
MHEGSCLCGGVTFELHGPLQDVLACHCLQCRKTSGHYWAATHVPRDKLRLIKRDTLRWYGSSKSAERGFCQACGASLFYHVHDSDGISIAAGSIDGETHCVMGEHWFTAMKGDYYALPKGENVRPQEQDIDVE